MGAPQAEEVRDLCVIAKTQNVTLLQCAEGFRFLNQLKNCGLKLDDILTNYDKELGLEKKIEEKTM
jgi:hypothetical protein